MRSDIVQYQTENHPWIQSFTVVTQYGNLIILLRSTHRHQDRAMPGRDIGAKMCLFLYEIYLHRFSQGTRALSVRDNSVYF